MDSNIVDTVVQHRFQNILKTSFINWAHFYTLHAYTSTRKNDPSNALMQDPVALVTSFTAMATLHIVYKPLYIILY